MKWREKNEEKIATWLGVPSDVRVEKNLFEIANPMPRPKLEMDEDMFIGPRHRRTGRRGRLP